MASFDVVIRGGSVVDGTGAEERTADVAIRDGRIVEVGKILGSGTQEIDADGAIVAPGWVDVHCHYDGQATWDQSLAPSSWHGVTSVVMGNCGVGFAPVHDHDHDRLVELMEGVEDIPGVALHEGLSWDWNDFPGFLDAVAATPKDIDVAAQVPHAAVRLHVMGERGAQREPATAEEIEVMGRIVAEGVDAGALGFTTSRTLNHKSSRGELTPTLTAAREELVGIAEAMGAIGKGVLQMVGDFLDIDTEFETLRQMAQRSGRPLSFSLAEAPPMPDQWRQLISKLERADADGLRMRAQVAPRAVGLLLGLDCTLHPFLTNPVFAEIADLDLAAKVAAMRDDSFRERLLSATGERERTKLGGAIIQLWSRQFPMTDPPDYEPHDSGSVAAIAEREGRSPEAVAYDLLLGDDGKAMLYLPFLNYAHGSLDTTAEMLDHPLTVPGLSDGGAHVGTICDVSFPTFLLSFWGRDRTRGRRFEVPWLIAQHTSATADLVGLRDRGRLLPGYRADINVIDFERLGLRKPAMQRDLPAGGRRVMQRADGYAHTFVAGVETYVDGEHTGAYPGGLVRGAQPAPAG